jgi:hypothetical protein
MMQDIALCRVGRDDSNESKKRDMVPCEKVNTTANAYVKADEQQQRD